MQISMPAFLPQAPALTPSRAVFPLGFSSASNFTRALTEACSEVNKTSSETPFTGSSKELGRPGVRPSPQPRGQGASVRARRRAAGHTPETKPHLNQSKERHKAGHCPGHGQQRVQGAKMPEAVGRQQQAVSALGQRLPGSGWAWPWPSHGRWALVQRSSRNGNAGH